MGAGFFQVMASYGFLESPDVGAILEQLKDVRSGSSRGRPTTSVARRSSRSGTRKFALWRPVSSS